jgi:hypothetical protein
MITNSVVSERVGLIARRIAGLLSIRQQMMNRLIFC